MPAKYSRTIANARLLHMKSKPLTSDGEKELADLLRVARNSRLVPIGPKTVMEVLFSASQVAGCGFHVTCQIRFVVNTFH